MPENLFGALREPITPIYRRGEAVLPHEMNFSPESMTVLNRENCDRLKSFFEVAYEKEILKCFYENIQLIYVVDAQGDILLAVEELLENPDEGIKKGVPKLVEHYPHNGLPKLGHPSLLPKKDKMARLSGEIRYKNGVWRANHYSGRYQGHKKYLENLVKEFGKYDIVIKEFEDL